MIYSFKSSTHVSYIPSSKVVLKHEHTAFDAAVHANPIVTGLPSDASDFKEIRLIACCIQGEYFTSYSDSHWLTVVAPH